ncbi:acyl-CoA dehydrogenase family protein [Actinoplanes sp. GCM10030250]|uniref:acyl-CoA dehydrogenase family protein n=1 Tax=Actinoplanes sp. GCM10030250 TaxID=3273376 RepID=UPI003618F2F2
MSEEREALREAVRGLLAGHATRAAIEEPGGYDAGLWARLCKEIGVAGLAIPQGYGGAGAGLLETHVVLEELGRGLTPGPMLSCVLAGEALLHADDEEARARLLPGICTGERVVTVAFSGHDGPAGEAGNVLDVADVFLVADAGGTLWEARAAAVHAENSLDLTRQLHTVRFESAGARRLGTGVRQHLEAVACVALSAEQVGAAGRALELTLDHAKTRFQFGRAIGSFQVLQHRLAEAHVRLEAARSASWTAAEALVAGAPEAYRLASVAKVCCSETFQAVAADMVQVHGGIAITWEHDAHLYLRRAYASSRLFGSPSRHVGRLAAAAGLT